MDVLCALGCREARVKCWMRTKQKTEARNKEGARCACNILEGRGGGGGSKRLGVGRGGDEEELERCELTL